MKEFIHFENLNIEIWRRPRQRRMYLTVREDGRVRVTCNRGKPRRDVLGFVADNRAFIARRTHEIERLRTKFPAKRWLSGESFLYFGRRLPLEVIWTWDKRASVAATDGTLELVAPIGSTPAERAEAITGFFRRVGRAHLVRRANELSVRTGLRPSALAVRGQRTRWGSCSSRGRVSLNWKLAAAPSPVIDYVILHEFAHLTHLDHSPRFWALVEKLCPEWKVATAWLKTFEPEINVQFGI